MTRIADEQLAELARLAGKATVGDWRNGWDRSHYDAPEVVNDRFSYYVPNVPDAMFIAAANPATVAALVAEVARLRAAVAEMMDYAEYSFERHEPGVTCRSCAVVKIGRAALDGAE